MKIFEQTGPATGLALFAMAAMVIGWVMLRTHRLLRRSKRNDAQIVKALQPRRSDPGHHLAAPDNVLRWEVQMHETERELSARLDSKMSALEALVTEADRAAARLESAMAAATERAEVPQGTPAPHCTPIRQDTPSPQGSPASSPSSREEVYTLADYGYDAGEIARRTKMLIGEVELILGLRGTPN